MNTLQIKTRPWQLLCLVITSTLMAELLSGSTSFSRINQLPLQFLLYGSAAIVIRGIVRTQGLGWASIILLGFAFGFFIEGLVLQSTFNPHFLNLDIGLGRLAGVNWVWTEYQTGLHCFWSITGAILFTEVLFPQVRLEPWIGKVGLWIWGTILLLVGTAIHFFFINFGHFNASPIYFVACAIVIAALVWMALKQPRYVVVAEKKSHSDVASFIVIAVITFAVGVLWFVGGLGCIFRFKDVPLWLSLLGAPVLLFIYFTLLNWWTWMKIENDLHRLALAGGLLAADLFLGYTGTTENELDHYGQIGLIVSIALWLFFLYRKKIARIEP